MYNIYGFLKLTFVWYFRVEVTGREGGQTEHFTAEPIAGGKTSPEKKQF